MPKLPTLLCALVLTACHGQASVTPAHRPITDGIVDVGGLSLHIHCAGTGAPTVVLDSGLGADGSVWLEDQREIARFTQVCAYDRAGLGYSTSPAAKPHTNRQMESELHALLGRAGIEAPYVLVGHSMGGVNVRLFASAHESEVAGMVLVDAVTDDQPARYWSLLPAAHLTEFRVGIAKLHEGLDYDTYVGGLADLHASSRPLGDKPLVVLTRGKADAPPNTPPELAAKTLQVWQEMQSELPKLSTNSVRIIATQSGHTIQWDAPRLFVAAVKVVVDAVRGHGRVNERALAPLANDIAQE